MSDESLVSLLFDLCDCSGVSGYENDAVSKAEKYLSKYMSCSIDKLGNLIARTEGEGIRVLLDAHIDRIGLIVTAIDEKGFVRVSKVGGVDSRVISASEVTIWGKKKVFGVVSSIPPHLSDKNEENKASKFDSVYVDIGMSREEAEKYITPGDRITFNGTQSKLCGNYAVSPCIDDRAGVAAILRCLEILFSSGKKICPLTVMFSAQEETGGSGAMAGSFSSGADEAIAVDVGFARAPGVKNNQAGKSGDGVMIGFAPSLDFQISSRLSTLADDNGIKWQYDVMGGRTGTNCDDIQISGSGIKTALLSIPLKNMHTQVEVVNVEDIESTAQLLAAYIIERSCENV